MEWSVFVAYAKAGFERAAAGFNERPSADNYQQLMRSAIVYQQVRGCPPDKREHVVNVAMGTTVSKLDEVLVFEICGLNLALVLEHLPGGV